ncbi:ECF transporter S component [Nocardiopsis kunsanensis]|uniref:ABC transporter permease n=1 Tax=Nocardiopsis kunsanensis TaxID=141693 RepID=A0A918XAN3_9ACTN|nr:ECF transporter S component [Nocardiopsis kunsanensis]GHD22636.1 ABC transporter permease [Nocardiopsis kunsanensis]
MDTESRSRTHPSVLTAARSWRTVDIVVGAVIGAAMGVVFWLWGLVWSATDPLFALFPPAQAVFYGVWLLAGVLGGFVIRKPGAAVLTSLAAAAVSMVLGTQWGVMVLLQGLAQGLLPELVFLATRYRRWTMGVAVLAGAVAGLSPAVQDAVMYYVAWPLSHNLIYGALVVLSSALIAGTGARLLTTSLARAGALTPFASAKD